jgi:hypothetical protein
MANEITVSASLHYSKNKASAQLSTSYSATQTGDKYESGVQIIGTTEESLAKNDVGTIGFLAVRNLDTTNFVSFGHTTGVYDVKVLPGMGAVIPWNGTSVFAKADTANCEVEYLLIEA